MFCNIEELPSVLQNLKNLSHCPIINSTAMLSQSAIATLMLLFSHCSKNRAEIKYYTFPAIPIFFLLSNQMLFISCSIYLSSYKSDFSLLSIKLISLSHFPVNFLISAKLPFETPKRITSEYLMCN